MWKNISQLPNSLKTCSHTNLSPVSINPLEILAGQPHSLTIFIVITLRKQKWQDYSTPIYQIIILYFVLKISLWKKKTILLLKEEFTTVRTSQNTLNRYAISAGLMLLPAMILRSVILYFSRKSVWLMKLVFQLKDSWRHRKTGSRGSLKVSK